MGPHPAIFAFVWARRGERMEVIRKETEGGWFAVCFSNCYRMFAIDKSGFVTWQASILINMLCIYNAERGSKIVAPLSWIFPASCCH